MPGLPVVTGRVSVADSQPPPTFQSTVVSSARLLAACGSSRARGGHKVFMQHDCAACHSGLPYAGLADEALVAGGEVEAKAAEIVVVHDHEEEAALTTATTLHGGACPPDLSAVTKVSCF